MHTAPEEHSLTRENYLRITREITDPTSDRPNPTYEFNTDIKQERLQYGPQKHTDKDPAEADTFMRTEDASIHVTLMRHTMTFGNKGSLADQIRIRRRREMIEILNTNPPPYHEGNNEYIDNILIDIPKDMNEQTFKDACKFIVQYYQYYIPQQYKDITHGLNVGDFRTLEWRMLHTQKPDTGPAIEPITPLDLKLGINIWLERQIHRYFSTNGHIKMQPSSQNALLSTTSSTTYVNTMKSTA